MIRLIEASGGGTYGRLRRAEGAFRLCTTVGGGHKLIMRKPLRDLTNVLRRGIEHDRLAE
jgi:hypothetical protein